MPFWRRGREDPSAHEGDAQTLAALRDAGSDLSKPAHVLVYLYFEAEQAAQAAADEVEQLGYEVTATAPGGGIEQWSVRGETHLAPTPEAIARLRAELTGIAERHEGEFDGWEASVEA